MAVGDVVVASGGAVAKDGPERTTMRDNEDAPTWMARCNLVKRREDALGYLWSRFGVAPGAAICFWEALADLGVQEPFPRAEVFLAESG